MTQNERLIRDFYDAFANGNYQTMQRSYHQEVSFSDPVFPRLKGEQVGLMWEMLVTSARDLKITSHDFRVTKDGATCQWEAWYTFSKTGRPVHNVINAVFKFRDGLIIEHSDRFDFYRWARQALGLPGLLLGWTPVIRKKVQQTAAKSLQNFISQRSHQN